MNHNDSVERLLRRASGMPQDAQPPGPCLEADTLAAWVDNTLRPEERAAAEAHVADCPRCLALVAAMAKTSPPAQPSHDARWLSVRWVVPLATAAVALMAWVLVDRAPAPPLLAPREAARSTADPSTSTTPIGRTERDLSARAQGNEAQKSAPATPAPRRLRDSAGSRRSAESLSKDSELASANVPRADMGERRSAEAPAAALPETVASVPQQSPAPPAAASPSPTSLRRTEGMAENVQSRAGFTSVQPLMIVSPDPTVQWRVSGPLIQRSIDSGRTWQAPASIRVPNLLAGASPSRSVCWLVGRAGAVLVTSDGETWRRLQFPDASADLVSVTAPDATTATVTTADGRSLSTGDGGRTWTPQENPPTPF